MTESSPSKVLEERLRTAADGAKTEDRFGNASGLAHYIFGLLGIVGGALAATAAGAGWPVWLSVAGGVLAAIAGGAAAFFDFERRAEAHWESAAVLRAVAEFAENRRVCLTSEDDACALLEEVQDRLDAARIEAARISSTVRSRSRIGSDPAVHGGDQSRPSISSSGTPERRRSSRR